MTDIVERLWQSDEASALTNEAAREIERLRAENERLRRILVITSPGMGNDPSAGLRSPRSSIGSAHQGVLNEQKER